jgi:hypothetical protein
MMARQYSGAATFEFRRKGKAWVVAGHFFDDIGRSGQVSLAQVLPGASSTLSRTSGDPAPNHIRPNLYMVSKVKRAHGGRRLTNAVFVLGCCLTLCERVRRIFLQPGINPTLDQSASAPSGDVPLLRPLRLLTPQQYP